MSGVSLRKRGYQCLILAIQVNALALEDSTKLGDMVLILLLCALTPRFRSLGMEPHRYLLIERERTWRRYYKRHLFFHHTHSFLWQMPLYRYHPNILRSTHPMRE